MYPPIGPGRVYLVVGPSGAGKDTLIGLARDALSGDAGYVFPRRVVTRSSGVWEDHDSLDREGFAWAAACGIFALAWEAHGLLYGVPQAVDDAVAAGRAIVCNVSRAVIAPARDRWANVRVIYVDAPAHVLAERLRLRGREVDADRRLTREAAFLPADADVIVDNGGDLDAAAAAFLRALR